MGLSGGAYIILLLWLWPILHVAVSSRSRDGAMLGWIILMLVFSWLAYAVYLIVTQPHRGANTKGV